MVAVGVTAAAVAAAAVPAEGAAARRQEIKINSLIGVPHVSEQRAAERDTTVPHPYSVSRKKVSDGTKEKEVGGDNGSDDEEEEVSVRVQALPEA